MSRRESTSGRPRLFAAGAVASLLVLVGCAGNRPVIYPDSGAARYDIEECKRLAQQGGAASGQGAGVARDTAIGAAMGGAATGIYGAVRGYPDAAERAAAGAAAGAAVGLIRGMVRASEPTETYRAYVDRCLRERGHDVIGWN